MKLPLNWLKEYVDIGEITAEELSDKLLSIGFEVEEIIKPTADIAGVVVGRVDEMCRHENSDKLWICRVNIGSEVVQIVTGAQNVKERDCVPVAVCGACLPGGKRIVPTNLRGVDSFGMLCSGSELNVDDTVIDGAEVDGILILPNNCVPGENILKTLGLDDTVLDISITANRPDCHAVINIALEIAILLDKKFKMPKMTYTCSQAVQLPSIRIDDKELCSKYLGRMITDIKIEKSPKWMRDRLRMCGVRSICNFVDITNYVLLEIGQPLHAFDRRFINGGIIVRKGTQGESIVALDGNKYDVEDILVIADHEKPLAIAGIMGGEYTSVFDDTQEIFLESARFERSNIRKSSRKIGLRSDSSSRYEKGVDWQSVELGSNRALALIDQLKCGKICSNSVCDQSNSPKENIITTSKEQICSLLGIDIDQKIIVSILKKQDYQVKIEGKKLICKVPMIREDVDDYPDLAEDIMRFYGYDNIVCTHLENSHQTIGGLNTHDKNMQLLRDKLKALGIYETFNYSFYSPENNDKILLKEDDYRRKSVAIKNPLSKDMSVMRTQLISSMLVAIGRNVSRKNRNVRFYELNKAFIPSDSVNDLPEERDILCVGICCDGDFYTIKHIVSEISAMFGISARYTESDAPYLHPRQSYKIDCDGVCGEFGKVHPLVCENYELPFDTYIVHLDITDQLNRSIAIAHFKPFSKLQPVDRDVAVVVQNNVKVGDMLAAVKATHKCISQVNLFDIYEGEQIKEGYKSVAFSVRLQPDETTFTDSEIKDIMTDIFNMLQNEYKAALR